MKCPLHGKPADLKAEEMRFYQLIERHRVNADGTEELTLACGHTVTYVIPVPSSNKYAPCAQCVHAWIAAEKARKTP
jgi:hypothetical protein